MLELRQRTAWESLLRWLFRSHRERQDAELRATITALVADPALPCVVDGQVIIDGYGRGPTGGA